MAYGTKPAPLTKEEKIKKGKEGEEALNIWLKEHSLPYLHVGQSPDTFSTLFPESSKRPDFLVLLQSLGLIAVDAKNYNYSGGVFTLTLEEELRKMLTFERLFRIPVWFAYMHEKGKCWYWISGLKAVEVGDVRENSQNKKKFLAIKKQEFAEIRTIDDLGKLYTQRILSLDKIGSLLG